MDNQIPFTLLISKNSDIVKEVQDCFYEQETVATVTEPEQYETIAIESPDLIILDFTDWELGFEILDKIIADPWLHHQSIITICSSYEVTRRIEGHRSVNLIGAVSRYDIEDELGKLLKVVRHNSNLLFHRTHSSEILQGISGSFEVANDLVEAECLTNLISSFLYNSNRIDWAEKNRLKSALIELALNAIEHGNCRIGFSEKQDWLEENKLIEELINRKVLAGEVAGESITFSYDIRSENSTFKIADCGDGFNWQEFLVSGDDVSRFTGMNGRGIIMATSSLSSIDYNEAGNEVTASIDHLRIASNEFPAIIRHLEPEVIEPGEVIINQDDMDSSVFFIVRGAYQVLVNDSEVATLTPDDIFIGEMAFLLNGRRSATIRSVAEGQVIRISRAEFLKILKEHAHYSIFLARLLAQRLDRLNSSLNSPEEESGVGAEVTAQ